MSKLRIYIYDDHRCDVVNPSRSLLSHFSVRCGIVQPGDLLAELMRPRDVGDYREQGERLIGMLAVSCWRAREGNSSIVTPHNVGVLGRRMLNHPTSGGNQTDFSEIIHGVIKGENP